MSAQLGLFEAPAPVDNREGWRGTAGKGEISATDPLPPGPYGIGLTHTQHGDEPPYTVVCGDGRAIAGHVNSKACADAIAEAMNARFPALPEDWQQQDSAACFNEAIRTIGARVRSGDEPIPTTGYFGSTKE